MKTSGDGIIQTAEKTKRYEPVPRDRDQVFHVTQGWLPKACIQTLSASDSSEFWRKNRTS